MTLIGCKDYEKMADQVWSRGDSAPKSGIISVDIDSIREFFQTIRGSKEKYTVISAGSDYGPVYAKEHAPWMDLDKAVSLFARPELSFEGIQVTPRVDLSRSNKDDDFAVKCYSWTSSTFPEIPSNVIHWYVNNSQLNDSRVSSIPFGINDIAKEVDCKDILSRANKTNTNRPIKVFCSWQFCTKERLELWKFCELMSKRDSRIVCKYGLPFEEYVDYLCNSQYVLCPRGNGIQCFRELEAIAANCIPVTDWQYDYAGLPVWGLPSLYNFILLPDRTDYSIIENEKCSIEYWQNKIHTIR